MAQEKTSKKKTNKVSDAKRHGIQAVWAFLTNSHVSGFVTGKIYTGKLKNVCVPGLNCYSCPGAVGACPIGSLQAVVGSWNFKMAYYVVGFLIFIGAIFGRLICGFLCPFGLIQDLLNKSMRSALGALYVWKNAILVVTIILSIIIYRPFCKYICPLGAFYSVFNKVSFFKYRVNKEKCVGCGKCAKVCRMQVDPVVNANSLECIRCGRCKQACPTGAISCGVSREKNNI